MSLTYLDSRDFRIERSTRGDVIQHNLRGFSLILFYSTQCVHCQDLIPIFKSLPGTIFGCQFGMINVSTHREVVAMSHRTIMPIKYVPFIVFFIDGKPFMRYDGPHDEGEIRKFVFEVHQCLQNRQQFAAENVREPEGSGIPAYTIGIPLYGDEKKCYLEYDDAYQQTPGRGRGRGRERGRRGRGGGRGQ